MNFYKKYCANTWVAATQDEFEKGDYITLTTKRGKENEHIVWNFLGKDREGNNLYSITRADGYNLQERAKAKAERYAEWAESRKQRAEQGRSICQSPKVWSITSTSWKRLSSLKLS